MKTKSLLLSFTLLLSMALSACGTGNSISSEPSTIGSETSPQTSSTASGESDSNTAQSTGANGERHLNLTIDGTDAFTASLIGSPATEEFLTHLPLTLDMTDYLKREKHAGLPFSVADDNLRTLKHQKLPLCGNAAFAASKALHFVFVL